MKNLCRRLSALTPSLPVFLITITSAIVISACKPAPTPDQNKNNNTVQDTETKPEASLNADKPTAELLANQLWQQGLNHIRIVEKESRALNDNIKALLANPNEDTLRAAHAEWKLTFLLYQELEPFLFIEQPSLSESLKEWRFTLAAWPLQPGYLDSYDVYIQSGIVNDITLPITTESLRKQHGLTDTEEVTLGLYAIEYLLWGDKEAVSPKRLNSQKKVPLAFEQAGLKINELPNNRRRQLLEIQAQLFADDLSLLATQWQEKGALSTLFSQLSASDKLFAFDKGLSTKLNAIDALLGYEIDINEGTDKVQKNMYPERFKKNRQQAIKKQLTIIESLYFSNATGHDTQATSTVSLATVLLSPAQQEELKLRIGGIKKQLTE